MSATLPRSLASTSAPFSTEAGLMPDLYRTAVGPVNSAYYQQQFQRFETLGKVVPSWNHGAAFFTLAWMLLRRLWRPAMLYAGLLGALLLLWWGLHGRLSLALELALLAAALLVLCVVPGLMGNALYYHSVRGQTLQALAQSRSLAQTRTLLQSLGSSTERFHTIAAVQALVSAVLAGLIFHYTDWSALRPAAAPQVIVPVGPPALVIPSVASLQAPVLQPADVAPASDREAPDNTATWVSAPDVLHVPQPASADTIAAAEPSAPDTHNATEPAATHTPEPAAPPSLSPVAAPDSNAAPVVSATAAAVAAASAAAAPAKVAATPAPPPAPAAAKVPARPAASLVPGKFYLNAGVYAQEANVQRATLALTRAKLPVLPQTIQSNKGSMTRLRIGPFDTRQQALQAAATAERLQIEASVFQQPQAR